MKKLMEITWEELQLGDMLPDSGAKITKIFDWESRPCYELITKENILVGVTVTEIEHSTVMSDTHLIAVKTEVPFTYEDTVASKAQTGKQCINWISAGDAYNHFEDHIVPGIKGDIVIKPYKNLEPQRCRCVSTSKGVVEFNGGIWGNSCRGTHSLESMKDIVSSLVNDAHMSEDWISRNLYLDVEAIKRMTQMSGLKTAFNDVTKMEYAWNPETDGNYIRKTNMYLNREASNYINKYLQEHPETVKPEGNVQQVAVELGWNLEAAKRIRQSEIELRPNGTRAEGRIHLGK